MEASVLPGMNPKYANFLHQKAEEIEYIDYVHHVLSEINRKISKFVPVLRESAEARQNLNTILAESVRSIRRYDSKHQLEIAEVCESILKLTLQAGVASIPEGFVSSSQLVEEMAASLYKQESQELSALLHLYRDESTREISRPLIEGVLKRNIYNTSPVFIRFMNSLLESADYQSQAFEFRLLTEAKFGQYPKTLRKMLEVGCAGDTRNLVDIIDRISYEIPAFIESKEIQLKIDFLKKVYEYCLKGSFLAGTIYKFAKLIKSLVVLQPEILNEKIKEIYTKKIGIQCTDGVVEIRLFQLMAFNTYSRGFQDSLSRNNFSINASRAVVEEAFQIYKGKYRPCEATSPDVLVDLYEFAKKSQNEDLAQEVVARVRYQMTRTQAFEEMGVIHERVVREGRYQSDEEFVVVFYAALRAWKDQHKKS